MSADTMTRPKRREHEEALPEASEAFRAAADIEAETPISVGGADVAPPASPTTTPIDPIKVPILARIEADLKRATARVTFLKGLAKLVKETEVEPDQIEAMLTAK